ncbi:NADH-quinone oxidoreductase subunit N [Iamia sp. SCSIO 61187]|uniref:NADH-quinone oxidoreductase subunit N n=1 Tax=Iamia sp. SCSIO 61187 TaxID=2722752 RepID=UPI001C637AC4|nr:NADH-quinone oxidoreductase subunit N [Iamia sp. SCSIO 61187]QYG94807.1 NADH-quinone oxidoreductase subunit N [Iamia sp. SCSIO 61187]
MNALLLAQADAATVDTPPIAWSALSPFLVMVVGAIVLLIMGGLLPRRQGVAWGALTTVAIALGTIVAAVLLWRDLPESGDRSVVAGAYAVDGFSLFLIVVIAVGVIIAALLTDGYMRREDLDGPEAYILYVVSAAGGIIMCSAGDLIVLFLGLEILSIAAYVLAGLHRRRLRSGEAALKYFVLGGFSSAFFLYGIALVYGATGSTSLAKIADFLAENRLEDEGLLLAGIGLLVVGFGFKVAAAPFHAWTPDVYQGSPSPVVSFMATSVKAAGFAGMLRVLVVAFETRLLDWQPIVYGLAVASLVVGAVLAVVQTDVKRMMAYSSINHAGFMLIAVATGSVEGVAAVLFYLASYTVMVGGTFGVITVVGRRGDGRHSLGDYSGLARREPLLALALTVFLLAQAGTPLTSGFLAKFYAVQAVVEADSFWLGLVAMLTAVVSAFLYLRIVLSMYAGATDDEAEVVADGPVRRIQVPVAAKLTIGLALIATIGLGVVPDPLTRTARDATPSLLAEVPDDGAEAAPTDGG